MDLMVEVIPEVCRCHPNVDFVVGGDGPRRIEMEEMIERNSLYDRVELLGEVQHADVKHVLRRGQIFLNCSLTVFPGPPTACALGVVLCCVGSGSIVSCHSVSRLCCVVWCGVVCRRRCYQMAMARMVLHTGNAKPGGLRV